MSVSESDPLQMFLYAIKSPETKRKYVRRLDDFFDFIELKGSREQRAKKFVNKARDDNYWAYANLLKYITFQKGRAERGEISESTVANYYKPIKLFLEMNDITLSWKKISRGIPRGRKYAADRAPTLEEITTICEYPDRRIKSIVYTMCSSGIRLGAWDYLKWKNVTPIKRDDTIVAAKLVVYEGDDEQYFSFITPEAYNELKRWMDFRKSNGESISDDSWIMRDLWDIQKFSRGLVTVPKQLKALGIKSLMERALKSQGIRKSLPSGQKRYEFQADHGFRKFFKTRAEQIMKPINVEVLMGHSTGISDSYYRPNEGELVKDYLKALPELTVSPVHRQELKITKQDEIISELKRNQTKIQHLEEGVNIIGALFAEQKVKNHIWNELENPTHHHTEKQIRSLKKFSSSQLLPENWEAFLQWSKIGPKVYHDN